MGRDDQILVRFDEYNNRDSLLFRIRQLNYFNSRWSRYSFPVAFDTIKSAFSMNSKMKLQISCIAAVPHLCSLYGCTASNDRFPQVVKAIGKHAE